MSSPPLTIPSLLLSLWLRSGQIMAVKQMALQFVDDEALHGLQQEIETMRSLRHRHIVRYLGTERTESTFSIFMEYISGGSISRCGAGRSPTWSASVRWPL